MGIIAIVGAGNVGQAIAGHMTLLGHEVRLYSRWERDFEAITSTVFRAVTLTDPIAETRPRGSTMAINRPVRVANATGT